MRYLLKKLLWVELIGLLIFPLSLKAQYNLTNEPGPWEISTFTGTFLPMNIYGASEVIGLAGFRISKDIGAFLPEVTYISAKGHGIIYTFGMLSWRGAIEKFALEGIIPHWTIGVHASQWLPSVNGTEQGSYTTSGGYHMGFGVKVPIDKFLSLRSGFTLGRIPGWQLLYEIGFSFSFGPREDAEVQYLK